MDSGKVKLMKYLQAADFSVYDTNLYLDTHPCDENALAYFNKHNNLAKQIREEYVDTFGPLRATDVTDECYWQWVKDPWPWELED